MSDSAETKTLELNHITELNKPRDWKRRLLYPAAACALLFLIGMGVMAKNGWLPSTDPMTGKKTGWFGAELAKNASSSWNPMAAPMPSPTITPLPLSKEYIYAGSRLLAVEDANANAAPPTDVAVWRPSTGYWHVLGGVQGSQQTSVQWGSGGDPNNSIPPDRPVAGDYDGDGKTDFCVFRPSVNTWYIIKSSTGAMQTVQHGASSDIPLAADFDGDGKSDLVAWRVETNVGKWYVSYSSTGFSTYQTLQHGQDGDIPFAADFDGDGKADMSIFRNGSQSYYYVKHSSNNFDGYSSYPFGQTGDKPAIADYDGDGLADLAVWRSGSFIVNSSLTGQTTVEPFGAAGDILVPNDYDGDGKADMTVWRPSTGYWYIRQSSRIGQSGEPRSVQWGAAGDTPVPAYYRR